MVPKDGFSEELVGGTSVLSTLPSIHEEKRKLKLLWVSDLHFMYRYNMTISCMTRKKYRRPFFFRVELRVGIAVKWFEDP